MKKTFVGALLVLSVLFSLVGCGGDVSDSIEFGDPQVSSSIQVDSTNGSAQSGSVAKPNPSPLSEPTPIPSSTPESTPTNTPGPDVESSHTSTPEPTSTPTPTPTPSITKDSTFSIHFIDVGQADAALVECDGEFMLIDGGNKADSNVIYSVLKKASAKQLKLVVGTHAHEDHIGGLPGAFNYATADLTLCPVNSYDSDAFEDFARYAQQKGGGIVVPSAGDVYPLGSATVTILGLNGGSDTNDTSIVLKIQYGETSFLFTGDAEREAEQAILNSDVNLSSTVLKVGHHGSDSSTSYVFLREIMPQYAVISVGEGNSYGHPTEAVLSRLRDAGVETFRTDLQGDIYCSSNGKNVSFSVTKNAGTNTLVPTVTPTPIPPLAPTPTPEPTPTPIVSGEPDPTPVGKNYILNTNTKKFHYPDCRSVKQMKEANKVYYTGSRDDLISRSYSPCGNCNP